MDMLISLMMVIRSQHTHTYIYIMKYRSYTLNKYNFYELYLSKDEGISLYM